MTTGFRSWGAVVGGIALAGSMSGAPASAQDLRGHGGPVRAVAALANGGGLATGGFDSVIIVWDPRTAAARRVLRLHDSTVNALAGLPGDCLASAGEDARIAIWCGGALTAARVLSGHTAPVAALAVAPDGRTLASAGWDHTIRLWSLGETGSERIVPGHDGPVNGIAFTPDGTALLSAGYDGQVRLNFLAAGRAPLSVRFATPVNAVAVAPDGEIVTAGADGIVRFHDGALQVVAELALTAGPLTTAVISPDGSTVAVAGLRTPVTVIDRRARQVRHEILGPGLPVWSLAFSPDGATLYSGGADRAVRAWTAATGRPAGEIASGVDVKPESTTDPGARVFRACRACHGVGPEQSHLAGPTLHAVFGRRIASAPGYAYSEALKGLDIVWTAETIDRLFEIGPAAMTPGTKMPEQRITDPADRKALVEWLAKVTKPGG